jgi:hypothetical protein
MTFQITPTFIDDDFDDLDSLELELIAKMCGVDQLFDSAEEEEV